MFSFCFLFRHARQIPLFAVQQFLNLDKFDLYNQIIAFSFFDTTGLSCMGTKRMLSQGGAHSGMDTGQSRPTGDVHMGNMKPDCQDITGCYFASLYKMTCLSGITQA